MMFRLLLCLTAVGLAVGDTLFFKPQKVQDVICPDKKSSCPSGATCCQLATGGYACCPLPKAVCCSDHLHCCPAGDTCDVKAGKCNPAVGGSRPWVKKTPAKPLTSTVLCPGGQFMCPTGNTCCQQAGGGWGCCPFPKAVCCSDRAHCCPSGYKCDLSHGTCAKAGAANVLLGKVKEAQVSAGSTAAKKPQQKQTIQIKTGMKQQVKEGASKQTPKTKPVQKVPPKVQPPKKVQQTPAKKSIPKDTVKTTPMEAKLKTTTSQLNAKLKAKIPPLKVVQSKNPKVQQAQGQAKSHGLGSLPTQSGKQSKKLNKKNKKEEKKMLETIKDTIHATVTAIKDTVHRVVAGSVTDEKPSGKKQKPKKKKVPTATLR